MPVINRIAEFSEDMKAWRRHLHAHPELMFDCHETAAFVAARLREFGVDEVVEGLGETGLVGLIHGQGPGDVIGLRADMDALPIEEVRDLPYKSEVSGKMHACGHDGHTTMLLGAAKYLAETRNFAGSVALIFQPAEEGGGGGLEMIKDGLMSRFGIREVYALHNWPGLEEGAISMTAGATMASADKFDIVIKGKGAHAAFPHLSVDPIQVAMLLGTALQGIVSRSVDPTQAAVVSITQIQGGTAFNVIPEDAVMHGTVRCLDEGVRQEIANKMKSLCEGIAAAHGAEAVLDYRFGYPVTVNTEPETAFTAEVARGVVGDANVREDWNPEMGSEDFSYMLQEVPGTYFFLGQGESAGLHHPEYDFNDAISPIGASVFARIVETAQPVKR